MTKELTYLNGFNNEHQSEALSGALPIGQFNPQKHPLGLYTEQFSTTAFTAPRATNRRCWFYRIQPSVCMGEFKPIPDFNNLVQTAPSTNPAPPNPLRWDPPAELTDSKDFLEGLTTMAVNGDVRTQAGLAIHLYQMNRSMAQRYFYNADGELLFVPEQGELTLKTECGILNVKPGEIAVIPSGMVFSVEITDGATRGYLAENYGAPLTLPERGPVGANGYANDRDFLYPVAAYDDDKSQAELICKFGGHFYAADIAHSPLNVVAWVGNSAPYKYDLSRFNVINTVSYDHPDPSIFTVLTSPSDTAGVANLDFVIFPPRWMVAENTFRPPWFHRNRMSEFMGLIQGVYDAKEKGFNPGGCSLHNSMTPHGPEADVFAKASSIELKPEKYENTLAFMLESRYLFTPTQYALTSSALQKDYQDCWKDLNSNFNKAT